MQTCPHPNACLSCDNFLTDPSFRTVHEQQLAETKELRERAERQGSLRLVEVLERDQRSLRCGAGAGRRRARRRPPARRGDAA